MQLKTVVHKALAAFMAAVGVAAAAWLWSSDLWLPAHTSRISVWRTADIFNYCTLAPLSVDAFGQPSAALVREAEAGLAAHLAARKRAGLPMPAESPVQQPFTFHHQYIGFVMGGERVLFVNAFPYYHDPAVNDFAFQVFERPECVADGGRHFWRVIYHPDTKSFSDVEFNGPA
jgi:hypothetical protein